MDHHRTHDDGRTRSRGYLLFRSPMEGMAMDAQMLKSAIFCVADIIAEMPGMDTPEKIIQFVWEFAKRHDIDPEKAVQPLLRRHLRACAQYGEGIYSAGGFAAIEAWLKPNGPLEFRNRKVKDGAYSETWEEYAAYVLAEAEKSNWRASALEFRATLKAANLVERIDHAPFNAKLKSLADGGDAKARLVIQMAEHFKIPNPAELKDDKSEPSYDEMAQRICNILRGNALVDTVVQNFGNNGFTVVHPNNPAGTGAAAS